jgi:hypothetical protein
MEHIVQFAIGIDDNAIVKRIEENAEKTITEELKKKVASRIFQNGYRGEFEGALTVYAETLVEKWFKDHKTEIIECAGKHLAERLVKTKAVKEMVEGLKNE